MLVQVRNDDEVTCSYKHLNKGKAHGEDTCQTNKQ